MGPEPCDTAPTLPRPRTGLRAAEFVRAFFAPEIRAWLGEQPLWRIFWIYGVLASVAAETLFGVAAYQGRLVLQQALLACFVPYTAWLLVSVWRCAENVRDGRLGILARQLTVVWAGNTIMVVGFLELDLITRLVRP